MSQHTHVLGRIVFLSLLTALVGCSKTDSGPQRYDVTGFATFDGAVISAGHVAFVPDASKGNNGPAGTGVIENGVYSTNGKGVVGGAYTVRVLGFDGKTDMEKEMLLGMPLFSPHEFKVDLPTVEQKAGEPETMDIDVPKEAAI